MSYYQATYRQEDDKLFLSHGDDVVASYGRGTGSFAELPPDLTIYIDAQGRNRIRPSESFLDRSPPPPEYIIIKFARDGSKHRYDKG